MRQVKLTKLQVKNSILSSSDTRENTRLAEPLCGTICIIHGLTKASRLNDQVVLVVQIDTDTQRYDVHFLEVAEEPVKIKDCNQLLWQADLGSLYRTTMGDITDCLEFA